MKRAILLAAAAVMTLSTTLAQAQTFGGRDGRDGRNDNNNRSSNAPNTSRNDNRGGQQWQRGQQLDQRFRDRGHEVNDWNRYRLSAPPRGYRYYRTDDGDFILAAIATGLIASVIASDINNNNDGYYDRGGAYPNYGPDYGPNYGPSYGGERVWYDAYGRPYTVDRYGRSVWLR